MEHILVPNVRGGEMGSVETRILKAIEKKRGKGGGAYASGKVLVVFLTTVGGEWFPNKVAKRLPDPLYFATVWVAGLQGVEAGEYVYGVTQLDLRRGDDAPTWLVRIGRDFDVWKVERIQ